MIVIYIPKIPFRPQDSFLGDRCDNYSLSTPIKVSFKGKVKDKDLTPLPRFDGIPWLTTDWVLSQFSGRLGVARRAYERFVLEDKRGGRQEEYHRGAKTDSRILGDDTFIDRVLSRKERSPRRKESLELVLREVCKGYSVKEQDLRRPGKDHKLSEARGMAAWLVMELGVCTLVELGKVTGRDVSTLSPAVKRLQRRTKTGLKLATKMKAFFDVVS